MSPQDFFTKAVYITSYGKGAVWTHYAHQQAEYGGADEMSDSDFENALASGDY